ncbi:MAG: dehydrogenase E1 component subunit alpha/beta [Pseudomonadota bacterium]|nr:dehydrogenase E1 component subunit alpha/beta [Pseudomonadota bacterium]
MSSDSMRHERGFLLDLYQRMLLIREFEDTVKFLFLEGTMPGTIHQCQGQEATAVGVCTALGADDWITSTFRGHGHAIAKGLSPQELMDELFGAESGCCKGRGGSMHVGNMSKGMVPGIAIVAGGIPLAAGMALSFKMEKKPHVVAAFFGDGAVAEGAFHEGVNMAAIWNLPLLLVCENNLYGASTHVDLVMKNSRIAERAASYGFRGETVDGNDVLAVYEASQRAVAECRKGQGPVLLELLTYRRTGHSRRDPCHYQPKDEREAWAQRDPIERFAAQIELTAQEHEIINTRVQKLLAEAVERAKVAPHPDASGLTKYVFSESPPSARVHAERTNAVSSAGGSTRRLGIAEALREGIAEEMKADPRVFCIGEDIGVPGGWGGAFTVTLGLEKQFPDRLINTPIAELGFFGLAAGAAMMGLRPIADVQYGDFLFLASDQIINNAAKMRYMSGGTASVPLVMRAPVGATGRGSQHAQNMERYFTGVPGLKVVAPSNAYDAKGLLKAAIRDGNPVLMFEHKLLYGSKGARAEGGAIDASSDIPNEDYIVPLDKAAVRREGTRVTVLAWLLMVHYAMQAAEGMDAEVIDVRSLSPIDWETIGASVRKTGRAVIVEEGPITGGVAAELAAGIAERWPAVRVHRVASPDVPVPFTPVLENAYRPDVKRISTGMRQILEETHG